MTRLLFFVLLSLQSVSTLFASGSVDVPDSLSKQLEEVVIKANQPATHLVGNKLVSTISGTSLSQLGTALDVMAQLPMLKVEDGAVSVVGKGAPLIFIDGRPLRDGEELSRIQSDNLKRVELDMAPGASYDSATRAVLHLYTRRSFVDGLSLTDRVNVSCRRKWSVNDMLDLNYHSGLWDVFLGGTGAHNNSLVSGVTVNRLKVDGTEVEIGSRQRNLYPSNTATARAGFNYADSVRSFGAYWRYNPESARFSNHGAEWYDDETQLQRDIFRRSWAYGHQVSVYYDDMLSDRYHLHVDADYRMSLSRNAVLTRYMSEEHDDVSSSDRRRSGLMAAKATLDFSLWGGRFTAGTQDSYTTTSLDYRMHDMEVGQYIPSVFSDARQTTAAVFASWSRTWSHASLTAGLRYEYVDYCLKVDGVRDDDVSRRDHLLTPDVSVGYAFDEQSQVGISYKVSTVRPPYAQLTGSLNYVGVHEIEGGNTALRDERMHDVQLTGSWRSFMLQADYTRSQDTYAFVKRRYDAPGVQLLLQPVNVDVSALDVYAMWSQKIGFWAPSVTLGVYRQWLKIDGMRYPHPIYSYSVDNVLSLPAGILLTVNVNGQSGGDMHTNRFGASWFVVDASLSRSWLDKTLQVRLSATDIFNTANNDWTMDTYGVRVDKRQRYDHRGVSLTLTYRFRPRTNRYKGGVASEDEMRRL